MSGWCARRIAHVVRVILLFDPQSHRDENYREAHSRVWHMRGNGGSRRVSVAFVYLRHELRRGVSSVRIRERIMFTAITLVCTSGRAGERPVKIEDRFGNRQKIFLVPSMSSAFRCIPSSSKHARSRC